MSFDGRFRAGDVTLASSHGVHGAYHDLAVVRFSPTGEAVTALHLPGFFATHDPTVHRHMVGAGPSVVLAGSFLGDFDTPSGLLASEPGTGFDAFLAEITAPTPGE